MTEERITLTTGVALDVRVEGPRDAPPIIFLHGYPESSRSWRYQQADLARDHLTIAPDQRGYSRSDKPPHVSDYAIDRLVADVLALADHYGAGRFVLCGHDWGGIVAWATALRHPERVSRLVIANAPHPVLFQRSLIADPGQRAASQYMTAFRRADMAEHLHTIGLDVYFDRHFAPHAAPDRISAEDRAAYLEEWAQPGALEAMLNWYKASPVIVPAIGEAAEMPAWLSRPFPKLAVPCLVIWGTKDTALLPVQVEGLPDHVPDLRVVRVEDAGHFVPWERPEPVTAAIRAFLAEDAPHG